MIKLLNTVSTQWPGINRQLNQLNNWQLACLVLLLCVFCQLPLIFNVGYFSHDELQWASRTNVSHFLDLPWEAWLGIESYQYRPLTFNSWLLASYLLFDSPYLFHTLLVIWGSLNMVLLVLIAREYQLKATVLIIALLILVLSPYVLYVHGWVGTIGDILVMNMLLLMIMGLIKINKPAAQFVLVLVLSVLALMSKESALSIPALFAVFWICDGLKQRWILAMVVSGLVASIYLGLRIPVLLEQPAETHYSLSFWHAPWRWLEYHFYWLIPNAEEPNTLFTRGLRSTVVFVGLILLFTLLALWQAQKKMALVWLAGSLALLLPVLPIASSASQYGYLFAAWTVFIFAAIWPHTKSWHKSLFTLLMLLSVWHGLKIMSMMQEVGQIQSIYSVQLAETVQNNIQNPKIKLSIDDESTRWVFKRLSHNIHDFNKVEIGNRVLIVEPGQSADFTIYADGRIKPSDN